MRPSLSEDRHQTKDGVRQNVTEDGHCVRHTVTRIDHDACRASRSVQRQDNLDRHVHGGHLDKRLHKQRTVTRLKHELRHALSVGLGIQGRFREQNGVFFWRNPEFIVECVGGYVGHKLTIPGKLVKFLVAEETQLL